MNINTIAHASTAIDTVVAYGAKAYTVASEVFTISAIMWCLNFMANMIEKTYTAGTVVGDFYFTHIHEWLMSTLYTLLITTVSVIAWTAGYLTYVYKHKHVYAAKLNELRDTVSAAFTYQSPALA